MQALNGSYYRTEKAEPVCAGFVVFMTMFRPVKAGAELIACNVRVSAYSKEVSRFGAES